MTSQQPSILSITEVFDRAHYLVPIYQRAYAWGEDQIATLLRDVHDYRERGARSYYIGALVTHTQGGSDGRRKSYEVVDGQQRLTTLFIVLATLSDMGNALTDVLTFEGRARSSTDLAFLARQGRTCSVDDLQEFGIKIGVETVRAAHKRGEFTTEDLEYLRHNVRIVRTTLPGRTDLNHYFEVMNSRGEQLEKHEIVKAALMGRLSDLDDGGAASRTFARIWDACSDMSRHVQSRFDSKARSALFSESWDELRCRSFADIDSVLADQFAGDTRQGTTISAILNAGRTTDSAPASDDSDATERYGAIIDFPNFLLHVLALSVKDDRRLACSGQPPVRLDDKQLVETFEKRLTAADDVTSFAFNLLRARYLFDRYVIKTDRTRESEDDSNWVLRRARKLESGKLSPVSTFGPDDPDDESVVSAEHAHVVMLQSMFQVTDSRRSYKNFLYAILEFLFDNDRPTSTQFVDFLARLADSRNRHNIEADQLNIGTSVPHFAFNYLDYLLWRGLINGDLHHEGVAYQSFRFRYRTSVEHFYPQHPDPDSQIDRLDTGIVDRFGNLCLMSRPENSKRSNLAPAAKISQYRSDRQGLKFQVMAAITRASKWEENEINDHGAEMIGHLNTGINTSVR